MTLAEIIANALWKTDGVNVEEDAAAILTALDAAGLTVVPKVPTPAMVRAAQNRSTKEPGDLYEGIWRAMRAAAESGGK